MDTTLCGTTASLKAAADRNRLRILKMLQRKAMCVCELTAILGISQPSVSRHLMLLRAAGLVRDERDGQWINYRLADDSSDPAVLALLALIEEFAEKDPQVISDRRAAAGLDRRELLCSGGKAQAG
jgi:ArsR family transcriptional regulator